MEGKEDDFAYFLKVYWQGSVWRRWGVELYERGGRQKLLWKGLAWTKRGARRKGLRAAKWRARGPDYSRVWAVTKDGRKFWEWKRSP